MRQGFFTSQSALGSRISNPRLIRSADVISSRASPARPSATARALDQPRDFGPHLGCELVLRRRRLFRRATGRRPGQDERTERGLLTGRRNHGRKVRAPPGSIKKTERRPTAPPMNTQNRATHAGDVDEGYPRPPTDVTIRCRGNPHVQFLSGRA